MIVMYSLGYRFSDINNVSSLVKTGGIYVNNDLTNVQVYLDGKYLKNNGLLIRNTLIQNLRPNNSYIVEIRKEGYNWWTKELKVYPSLVTEARVLMLPTEIDLREIKEFLTSEAGPNIATGTKPVVLENPEYLDLIELFKPEEVATSTIPANSTLLSQEDIVPDYLLKIGITDPEEEENLIIKSKEVALIKNGDVIIYWVDDEKSIPYYYCIEEHCRDEITLDWPDDILKFDFLPGRDDVFVVLNKEGIFAVEIDDRSERNVQTIYKGEDLDFRISDNNRIIVKEGEVFYEVNF